MSDKYVLHSMVRKVQTRTKRVMAPRRHRFVQRLGGGAITLRRGRPVTISADLLKEHLEEITQRWEEGQLEVRLPGGQVVDLKTMKAAPAPKPKPQPDPVKAVEPLPLEPKPVYPEGKAVTEELPIPAVASDGLPPGDKAEDVSNDEDMPEEDSEEVSEDTGSSYGRKKGKKRGKK